MTVWKISYKDFSGLMESRTPGNAVYKFLRILIRTNKIEKKPKSTLEGGWEGVSIEPVGGWKYGKTYSSISRG